MVNKENQINEFWPDLIFLLIKSEMIKPAPFWFSFTQLSFSCSKKGIMGTTVWPLDLLTLQVFTFEEYYCIYLYNRQFHCDTDIL